MRTAVGCWRLRVFTESLPAPEDTEQLSYSVGSWPGDFHECSVSRMQRSKLFVLFNPYLPGEWLTMSNMFSVIFGLMLLFSMIMLLIHLISVDQHAHVGGNMNMFISMIMLMVNMMLETKLVLLVEK